MRVAIVGAGLGGLATALALQDRGLKPMIFERASEFAPLGAGLTMCANANRVLIHLGLGEVLARDGVTQEQQYRDARDGTVLRRFDRVNDIHKYGAPYYKIHRGDLQTAMADLVTRRDGEAIRLGFDLKDIRQSAQSARLEFANGESVEADLVVGADGVRSIVRQRMFDTSPSQFTGFVAWRALVPAAGLPDDLLVSAISAGKGRMINRYLVRAGQMINVVCFARKDGWANEDWTTRSSLEEVMAEFGDFDRNTVDTLRLIAPGEIFKWALHTRSPQASWVAGRVVLLGDAVHPMLPFLGQGAAMAIEDAIILARSLQEKADLDEALALYQRVRKPRAEELVERSRMMASVFHDGPEYYDLAKDYTDKPTDPSMYDAAHVPLH